jgi:hypothetical protein
MKKDDLTPETTEHDRSLLKSYFAPAKVAERMGWDFPGLDTSNWPKIGVQGPGSYRHCPMCGHVVNDRDEVHLELRESQTRHQWCGECHHWYAETDFCGHLGDKAEDQ